MQLSGRRNLKFDCSSCCSSSGSVLTSGELDSKLRQMEHSLKGYFGSCMDLLTSELVSRIAELNESFTMLKETNIQLIHFCAPSLGPKKPNMPSGGRDPIRCLGESANTIDQASLCNAPKVQEVPTGEQSSYAAALLGAPSTLKNLNCAPRVDSPLRLLVGDIVDLILGHLTL